MLKSYHRNLWFVLGFCFFIILFDWTMASSPVYLENTELMNAGIALDYMLVVPAMLYFFIFRKKKSSLAPILICTILGYFTLRLILPSEEQGITRHLEFLLIPLELLLIAYEGRVIYRIISHFRRNRTMNSHPIEVLRHSIQSSLPNNALASFLMHDLSILYYTLFAWKSHPYEQTGTTSFRYHTISNWFIMILMISKILLIEGVAIHLLAMQWSHLAAWVLSIGNIYMILLFIADYRAMCLNPILLSERNLRVQYGIQMHAVLDMDQIESVSVVTAVSLTKSELKTAFTPLIIEPNIRIQLKKPQTITRLFGKRQSVYQIYLFLDEPQAFQRACEDNTDCLISR